MTVAENEYRQGRTRRHTNTRFLMIDNEDGGKRWWLTFTDCYRMLDEGRMVDGAAALDISGSTAERPLTKQEKDDITQASNDYSGDK